jgi:hypothetical protein
MYDEIIVTSNNKIMKISDSLFFQAIETARKQLMDQIDAEIFKILEFADLSSNKDI